MIERRQELFKLLQSVKTKTIKNIFKKGEGEETQEQASPLISTKPNMSSKSRPSFNGPAEIDPNDIKIEKLIGEGKFGKVYKGKCHSCDVAVKIPARQDLSERDLEKFRREVQIMRTINHPNVCLFMGACTRPGQIRILSELLSCDLESKLIKSTTPYPLSQRLSWAKEAAQGMAWLHANNPAVIHRDLKLANLLYDEHEVVKVCDFGLSHFHDTATRLRDSTPKGTPLYMSPEVMLGRDITAKVDVYSFGICVWEILTRTEAFPHHNNLNQFAIAICREGERPVIPPGTPESLSKLMQQCWSHSPDDRPSMPQVVERLEGIIKECEKLEGIRWIQHYVDDPNSRAFWQKYFIGRKDVPWKEFYPKFCEALQIPIPVNPSTPSLQTLPILCLQAVLVNNNTLTVELEKWGRVTGWFGPLELPRPKENGFLDRISDMLKNPWFHGYLRTPAAETLLGAQIPGTFLVRFSNAHKGAFSMSLVNPEGKVVHYLVPYKPPKGFLWENSYYESIQKIIATYAKKYNFKFPAQCDKFTWLFHPTNSAVMGYLNEADNAGYSYLNQQQLDGEMEVS